MQDKGVFSHAICGIYYIFFYSPPLAAKTEEKVRGNVFKVMNFIKMLCLIPYNALATLSIRARPNPATQLSSLKIQVKKAIFFTV